MECDRHYSIIILSGLSLIIIIFSILTSVNYREYIKLQNIYVNTNVTYTVSDFNKYIINVEFDNSTYELQEYNIIKYCIINKPCEFYYNKDAIPNINNDEYNLEYKLFMRKEDINDINILWIFLLIFTTIASSLFIFIIGCIIFQKIKINININ